MAGKPTASKILDFSKQKVLYNINGVCIYGSKKADNKEQFLFGALTLVLKSDHVFLTWQNDPEQSRDSNFKIVQVSDDWNLVQPLQAESVPNIESSIKDSTGSLSKKNGNQKTESIWINLGQQLKELRIYSNQYKNTQFDFPYIEMHLKADESVFIQNEPSLYSFYFSDGMVVLNSFVKILNRFCWLQKTNDMSYGAKCEKFVVLDHHTAMMSHLELQKKKRFQEKPVTSILGGLAKFSSIVKKEFTNLAKPIIFGGITLQQEEESIVMLDSWQEETVKKGQTIPKYALECPSFPENVTFSASDSLKSSKSPQFIAIYENNQPVTKQDVAACLLESDSTDQNSVDSCGIIQLISRKGIDPDYRAELWPFLFNMYPFGATAEQQKELYDLKKQIYQVIKTQWTSMLYEQECNFSDFASKKSLIEKDVNRADRKEPFYNDANNPNCELLHNILMTHLMYHFDLGYVQGMVDILTPMLYLFKDEVTTFWCFAGMIKKIAHNFDIDQLHTITQINTVKKVLEYLWPDFHSYLKKVGADELTFCFPWVLILLKRQFSYSDIFILWEKIITQTECIHYIVFLSATIVGSESSNIMLNEMTSDDILTHFNSISGKINVRYLIYLTDQIISNLKSVPHLPPQISELLLP